MSPPRGKVHSMAKQQPTAPWRPSNAHCEFLGAFMRPSRGPRWDWGGELGEPHATAIRRLVDHGLVEPCGLEDCVGKARPARHLKALLLRHGQRTRGNKQAIVRRALEGLVKLLLACPVKGWCKPLSRTETTKGSCGL